VEGKFHGQGSLHIGAVAAKPVAIKFSAYSAAFLREAPRWLF
jgi:hypothetical protein